MSTHDYRDILERQFESRRRGDPAYSRRAFARDLGLSASQLSEVMKGAHGLSVAKASGIARRLGLAPDLAEEFVDLVESRHARDARRRDAAAARLRAKASSGRFQSLDVDAFAVISEWYHLAILELAKVRSFRPDTAWIARALGLGAETALGAVNRLRRLGLVRVGRGRLEVVKDKTSTPDDVPSQAIRSFHAQIIGKARDALARQPVEEREYGTLLLTLRRDQIPEAKRLIREFQDRFVETLGEGRDRDDVYALAVQLFRLSDCHLLESDQLH